MNVNILTVHKGGPTSDPDNYRPICVVSVAAKVLETLIANQLQDYLKRHQLLHTHQGLIDMEDLLMIYYCMLLTQLFRVSITNMSAVHKAFDSLDHVILLA